MRQLSPAGQQAIDDIAQRHGFSTDATLGMLEAVIHGNGSQAQFSHPEFSGSGQWMRGGMTMVSDMFNQHLKGRVDGLCGDLSDLVMRDPDLVRGGSFQSQRQGNGNGSAQAQARYGDSGQPHGDHRSDFGAASLFVAPPPGASFDWWPADLRWPDSTGAQNGVRYACFSQARRLAIELDGRVTVYDTLDHRIGGFSQQQSWGGTLSFNSQYGLIDVASLPVISVNGAPPWAPAEAPRHPQTAAPVPSMPHDSGFHSAPSGNTQDIFATIERLADLRAKGILSDEEFTTKKAELLSRV